MARDSPDAADNFLRQITIRFEPLRLAPNIGAKRDQLAPGLRVHLHRGYGIYYVFDEWELIILRVVHGARSVEDLFS
nr:type II toxin-antitoxin system RelE/ParE family toxin [Breoghania sp. L-A4]